MNKQVSVVVATVVLALTVPLAGTAAPASTSDAAKRDAAIKAIRVESDCQQAVLKLSYAMPSAYKHGISQADAVAKIQTIASEQNKSLVRYMAILAYNDGTDEQWKISAKSYCIKQLAKRTNDDSDDDLGLLDGGNAMTLFQR